MDRRLTPMSSILILLLSSVCSAEHPVVRSEAHRPSDKLIAERIDLSLDVPYPGSDDFLDLVTMRSLPEGSLYTRYEGVHSVVMRQLRSQCRRFTRQALREGWYVPDDASDPTRDLYRQIDRGVDIQSNGAWWNRRWWESLPAEKGGAPAQPYVHVYGCENTWRLGPLSASNTMRVKFDYLAFFEIDPDPIEPDHPARMHPLAIDVRPATDEGPFGPFFRVDVKPRFQIGMPRDEALDGLLRGVSLQVSFEIWNTRSRLIKGDVAVRWRPSDGVTASFEVALTSW